jgi:hypothetical protein
VKSVDAMKMLDESGYSHKARIDIIHAVILKIVDVYGVNPSSAAKLKVAEWMGDLTKLPSCVYFDPKNIRVMSAKHLKTGR